MSDKLSRLWTSAMGIPKWVFIWVNFLMAVNMASVFFLDHPIGLWTAIAFAIVCITNMPTMVIQGGLTRMLSIPHFVWVPLLIFLFPMLFGPSAIESGTPIYYFGMTVFFTNLISLLFDTLEVYRWFTGKREILGLEGAHV